MGYLQRTLEGQLLFDIEQAMGEAYRNGNTAAFVACSSQTRAALRNERGVPEGQELNSISRLKIVIDNDLEDYEAFVCTWESGFVRGYTNEPQPPKKKKGWEQLP